MTISKEDQNEHRIVSAIVKKALSLDYKISLFDSIDSEGEWTVKRSTSYKEVMDAIASTGGDVLKFRNSKDEVVGSVVLIYGNGNDGCYVISDNTANDKMDELLADANEVADKLEAAY